MGKKVVKTSNEFQVGDTVFAKLKGYPFWPAKIEEVPNENGANKKYKILFYGTYETNWLKADVILPFNEETKSQYGNPRKSRSFNDAMWEIENDPGLNMTRRKRNEKRNEPIEEEEEEEEEKADDEVQESKEENETITEKGEQVDEEKDGDDEDVDDEPFIKESKKKKSHQSSKDQNAKRKKSSHKKEIDEEEADDSEEAKKKSRRSIKSAKSPIAVQEEKTNSSNETQEVDEQSKPKSKQISKSKKEKQKRKSIRQKQPNRRYLFDQSDDSNQSRRRNSTQPDERDKVDDEKGETINEKNELEEEEGEQEDDDASFQTEVSRVETSKNLMASNKSKLSKAKQLYEERKRALKEKKLTKKKLNLIANIRIQIALIRMDLEIKKSLRVDNTDIERCCLIMQDLLKLPIRAEHLFKTSEIVETTKKCRKFKSSEKIREISNECFTKFSKILNLNAGDSFWNEFEKERYKYITSNIEMLRKERSIANKILQEDLRAQKSKTSKQILVNSKVEEKVASENQKSLTTQSKESQENTNQIKDESKSPQKEHQMEIITTTTSQKMDKEQPDEQKTRIENEIEEKHIAPTETKDEIKS